MSTRSVCSCPVCSGCPTLVGSSMEPALSLVTMSREVDDASASYSQSERISVTVLGGEGRPLPSMLAHRVAKRCWGRRSTTTPGRAESTILAFDCRNDVKIENKNEFHYKIQLRGRDRIDHQQLSQYYTYTVITNSSLGRKWYRREK